MGVIIGKSTAFLKRTKKRKRGKNPLLIAFEVFIFFFL